MHDLLGPIILNTDGTTRRIANWDSLSEHEQHVSWKRISKRNEVRRTALLVAQEEAEAAAVAAAAATDSTERSTTDTNNNEQTTTEASATEEL